MRALLSFLALGLLFSSCGPAPVARGGVLDLRGFDFQASTVDLTGEWQFGSGWRRVPDAWKGAEAGGPDGRGSGTYRLKILLSDEPPELALRYRTASTAFRVSVNGKELAVVGSPNPELSLARSAFSPGTVRLPPAQELNLEIFVSNPVYRIGGLWEVPSLGQAPRIEADFWRDQATSLILGTVLGVIGFSSLLLFAFRTKERTFLTLGLFAFLVAFRSVVTGEYVLAKLIPWLSFDALIRLEYLTAFLPLPVAVSFFWAFFPGLSSPLVRRILCWPSLAFGVLAVVLPLDLLTRLIPWFYPVAIPTLVVSMGFLLRRVLSEAEGHRLLVIGALTLALAGLADMISAWVFNTTGRLVPWGLEVFVVLQATTLARRFLVAFQATEALLAARDQMVKEIHHNVKNSLQIVASLVSLQARRTPDRETKEVFAALRRRMTAISLVHEKLYGQGASGRPDLVDYLRHLVELQYPRDRLSSSTMVWEGQPPPLPCEVDYCIDSGLILTELLSNAHRHGIQAQDEGHWSVRLTHSDGWLTLRVKDDGPGFPEGFDPSTNSGLGFKLILTLLTRHEGTLTLASDNGGVATVVLKLEEGPLSRPS